jgi:hypothetical protein
MLFAEGKGLSLSSYVPKTAVVKPAAKKGKK